MKLDLSQKKDFVLESNLQTPTLSMKNQEFLSP